MLTSWIAKHYADLASDSEAVYYIIRLTEQLKSDAPRPVEQLRNTLKRKVECAFVSFCVDSLQLQGDMAGEARTIIDADSMPSPLLVCFFFFFLNYACAA